jgi:hypothetical protein
MQAGLDTLSAANTSKGVNFHIALPTRFARIVLIILVVLGGALRLHRLGSMSYSNDELSALVRADYNALDDVIDRGVRGDGHPAAVQLWLYACTRLFGTNELAVRLPFALCGILTIIVAFLLGKECFGETTGLLAAACVALLEFPVLQSQLARPYAPGMLWVVAAAWFLVRLLKAVRFPLSLWLPWIVLSILAAYTHYFGALAAVLLGIAGLFLVKARDRVRYLVVGFSGALAFLPHMGITVDQLKMGGLQWLPGPTWHFPIDHFYFIFNNSWFLLTALLIAIAGGLLASQKRAGWGRWRTMCLVLFLAPMLIGMVWSTALRPVLQNSVLLFTMPFGLLFIFSFVGETKVGRGSLVWLTAVLLASLLIERRFLSRPDPDPFKQVAELAAHWYHKYGAQNVLTIADVNSPRYLNFYLDRLGVQMTFPIHKCCGYQTLAFADSVLLHSGKPYLLFLSPRGEHDPRLLSLIQQRYPRPIEDSVIQKGVIQLSGLPGELDLSADTVSISSGAEFIGLASVEFRAEYDKAKYMAHALIESEGPLENSSLCWQVQTGERTTYWDEAQIRHGRQLTDSTRVVFVSGILPSGIPQEGSVIKLFIWNHDRIQFHAHGFDFVIFK